MEQFSDGSETYDAADHMLVTGQLVFIHLTFIIIDYNLELTSP